jgi:hypothetical protein
MHSERPDKHLAERLADMMPEGSTFREAAVWEELSASLQQKKKKNGWLVLRVAAALLLLPAAWWLMRNSRPEPVERPVVKTEQPVRPIPVQTDITEHRNIIVLEKRVQKHEKTKPDVPTQVPQDIALSERPEEIQAIPADTPVRTPDRINTESLTASVTPRRFRIAHINDNGAPSSLNEAMSEEKPSYTFTLARRQAGPSTDIETPSPEHRPRSFLSLKKTH